MAHTKVEDLNEAVDMLRELIRTPDMRSFHFEVDADIYGVPLVTYRIERIAYKKDAPKGEGE